MTIAKRLVQMFVVMWGVSTIVFFLQRSIPGNPADVILGADAPELMKQEWLTKYGFNEPIILQYGRYLKQVSMLNLGNNFASYTPVADIIKPRLWQTVQLASFAFCVSLTISILVGLISAANVGKWIDRTSALLCLLAVSAPSFIIGPIALWVFSVKLAWFPLTGNDQWLSFVLPGLTLGAALAALTSRMIRSGLVDVLSEDYIRTARSKGMAPWSVLAKHALRNAFLPALTILGMQLGVLLSGAVITEQIFSWPGLGSLTVEAVQSREYNVVSGCVLVMAAAYVLCNLMVDILYGVLDPRVRSR